MNHLESSEIAIVNSQDVVLDARHLKNSGKLLIGMHLDQARHPQLLGALCEVSQVYVG